MTLLSPQTNHKKIMPVVPPNTDASVSEGPMFKTTLHHHKNMWYWCFWVCAWLRFKISPSCLCYNHWCHTVWTQTLERRSCCLFFSFPRQIFPSFVLIMLLEKKSSPFFVFLFEVPQSQCGDLTPTAYYGLFLHEQQALIWHAEPCFAPLRALQVAEEGGKTHTYTHHKNKKLPRHQEKAFCFLLQTCVDACMPVPWETKPRTQIRRKTSEGKEEKAAKAVSGNDAMKGPRGETDSDSPRRSEHPTHRCSQSTHTHIGQLLIAIITAATAGRTTDWGLILWTGCVELFALEQQAKVDALKECLLLILPALVRGVCWRNWRRMIVWEVVES